MPTEAQVLESLSSIIDPDFQQDIVSLGFIKNLSIRDGNVAFDIELTTPACPVKAEFQRGAEEAVGALDGVSVVKVNMTSATRKPQFSVEESGLAGVEAIIAISSCKGGVGKSTVAASIARELSQRGLKIGLLDTDIFGPSIPTLFDLHPPGVRGNESKMMIPEEIDALKIMSFGFLLGRDPAVMRGPMVSNYMQQLLHKVAWGDLDLLLLDLPPGTGDVQLTISQSIQLNGAVIVTTPQALSLTDVEKGILMFDKVNVPVLGVIENMSYFECDGCGKQHQLFGDGTRSLTDRYGIDVLAQLPLAPAEYGRTFREPIDNPAVKAATDAVVRALGKNSRAALAKPQIEFDSQEITVTWPDGDPITVNNFALRSSCQCALCIQEMTGKPLLDPATIRPDIAAKEAHTVGNYAIQVTWNDDHSSGLFSYRHLRKVAADSETQGVSSASGVV